MLIQARHLAKRYGDKHAVDDLTFTVRPGGVTGFLGPNGAGKSTTLRLILGLDRPSAGAVTVGGVPFGQLKRPLHRVGALLDATAVPTGRTGRRHLEALAVASGIGRRRVAAVLAEVGLADAGGKRVGTYSLGMKQRLGIAAALLGDPAVLLFDEPFNGLDPEGIRWGRTLFQRLAAQGRTVLVASHLMNEMALTAERLVVIGRGRLIAETTVAEFTAGAAAGHVLVASPRAADLAAALRAAGATVAGATDTGPPDGHGPGPLRVDGLGAAQVGDLALAAGIAVHELRPVTASLEDAFMALTADSVEYRARPAAPSELATTNGAGQ
jgi:ABC-2 type transport system ATP-binding protein